MKASRRGLIRGALIALFAPGAAKAASMVCGSPVEDLSPGWRQLMGRWDDLYAAQERLFEWNYELDVRQKALIELELGNSRVANELDRRERLLDLRERFGSEAVRTIDWPAVSEWKASRSPNPCRGVRPGARRHRRGRRRAEKSRFGVREVVGAVFGAEGAQAPEIATLWPGERQICAGVEHAPVSEIRVWARAPARVTGIDACRRGAIIACGQAVKAGVRPADSLPIPGRWRAYQAPEGVESVGEVPETGADGLLRAGNGVRTPFEGGRGRAQARQPHLGPTGGTVKVSVAAKPLVG